MYDEVLHAASASDNTSIEMGLQPGGYLLATIHRAANTDDTYDVDPRGTKQRHDRHRYQRTVGPCVHDHRHNNGICPLGAGDANWYHRGGWIKGHVIGETYRHSFDRRGERMWTIGSAS